MKRAYVVLALFALVLLSGTNEPNAQVSPRPAPIPSRPQPFPTYQPPPPTYLGNICSTQWGFCNWPAGTVGSECICLTAQNQQVPGRAQYYPFPIEGPTSPYLRPHITPPQTIPN